VTAVQKFRKQGRATPATQPTKTPPRHATLKASKSILTQHAETTIRSIAFNR
jgi:hypothetical protein